MNKSGGQDVYMGKFVVHEYRDVTKQAQVKVKTRVFSTSRRRQTRQYIPRQKIKKKKVRGSNSQTRRGKSGGKAKRLKESLEVYNNILYYNIKLKPSKMNSQKQAQDTEMQDEEVHFNLLNQNEQQTVS